MEYLPGKTPVYNGGTFFISDLLQSDFINIRKELSIYLSILNIYLSILFEGFIGHFTSASEERYGSGRQEREGSSGRQETRPAKYTEIHAATISLRLHYLTEAEVLVSL